ncbi:MAG TPA: sigma-54 dependent transcriptional regulator [Anaerolineales bacterium]|nr:sigma-54 dependent transcriptional regulator [Anaerolineales bacterium]
MTAAILLVDDEEPALSFMAAMLRDAGYEVREAQKLQAAHAIIDRGEADIVVLDVQLPDGYGPDLLERLHREQPGMPVIMVTGYGDIEMAVEAMKLGAQDFIQKPIDFNRLRGAVEKAAEAVALHRELTHLRNSRMPFDAWVVGETPLMKRLSSDLARVAPSQATLLITGESGTGKDMLAATIHKMSPRANRPYIPVNCANFTDTLLESELFGHEQGAFTGAIKRKDGLFVTADGGTLFLDEISTMKTELQAHLLRALEDRSIRRLGGNSETKVDVRILTATNRNLPEMVKAGTFREDLYHRLNVVELRLPPLRERLEDIPALVGYLIQKYNREMGRSVQGVGPYVLDALKAHDWPGNIRQLRNAIERAMLFADGDTLEIGCFAPDIAGVFA